MNKKELKKKEHVSVFIRARPLQDGEQKAAINLTMKDVTAKTKISRGQVSYSFKRVFDTQSSQEELFNTACRPLVAEMLKGFSCTVFAYGQTNSGKTHSMMGSLHSDALQGMTPRSCKYMFNELHKLKCHFTVRLSCVELYKEEFYDMLVTGTDERKKLKIFTDANKHNVLKGVEEVVVSSAQEVLTHLDSATNRRATASTGMNNRSSRSHFIATLSVTIKEEGVNGQDLFKIGKLHLVDLAGSESAKRADTSGTDRQAEASNINKSLLALGRVISSLSTSDNSHVPYRESQLTRLLQDALGGKSKTSIITTISLSKSNLDETLSTLEYASSARKIENDPEMNRVVSRGEIVSEYETELTKLRLELNEQRSERGVYMSEDRHAELHQRLNELEADQVLKEGELTKQREHLAALGVEKAALEQKQKEKNLLLAHHQENEQMFEEREMHARERETAFRTAISARDSQEQDNFTVVGSNINQQTQDRTVMDGHLVGMAAHLEDLNERALTTVTLSKERCNEQCKDLTQAVQSNQKSLQHGLNTMGAVLDEQHAVQAARLTEARDMTVQQSETLLQKTDAAVSDATVRMQATTDNVCTRMSAAYDTMLQTYLTSACDASTAHTADVKATVAGLLSGFKQDFLTATAHNHDVSQAATMDHLGEVNTIIEEIPKQSHILTRTVGDLCTTTKAETIASADTLHTNLNNHATHCVDEVRNSVKAEMDDYTNKLRSFTERESAACSHAAAQRERIAAEVQAAQTEATAQIQKVIAEVTAIMTSTVASLERSAAEVDATMHAELNTIHTERDAAHHHHAASLESAYHTMGQGFAGALSTAHSDQGSLINNICEYIEQTNGAVHTAATRSNATTREVVSAHIAYQRDAKVKGDEQLSALESDASAYVDQSVGKFAAKVDAHCDSESTARIQMSGAHRSATAEHSAALLASVAEASKTTSTVLSAIVAENGTSAANTVATLERCNSVMTEMNASLHQTSSTTAATLQQHTQNATQHIAAIDDTFTTLDANMRTGVTEGSAPILARLRESETLMTRVQQNADALEQNTNVYETRGITPSPLRPYVGLRVNYEDVLRRSNEIAMATATPNPAACAFRICDDEMDVDDDEGNVPTRGNTIAMSPEPMKHKRLSGAPATPLADRSNVM